MNRACETAILNRVCPVARSVFTLLALCLYGWAGFGRLNVTYRTGPGQLTSRSIWSIVLSESFPGAWLNSLTVGIFYALWTFVLLLICYPNFFSRKSGKTLRARFGGINAALPLFSAAVLSGSLWLSGAVVRAETPNHARYLLSPVSFLWAIPLCVWLSGHQLKAHLCTPRRLAWMLLPVVPVVLYMGIFSCYALYDTRISIDTVAWWQSVIPVICAVWEGLIVLRRLHPDQAEVPRNR